jgi:hypothetical protein
MRLKHLLSFGLPSVFFAAAPVLAQVAVPPSALTPMEAVQRANAAAPGGAEGHFILKVMAGGRDGNTVYLNSEEDYRDQRCLTISVSPAAQAQLSRRFGTDIVRFLRGKNILVSGEARRVRIDFRTQGRPTGLYYYQTHVRVTDGSQVRLLD